MTTTAREISATNLSGRLSIDGPDDELTELGRTLDDLFGRLQSSFESQRQFVANASHELRTPLAGQRTLLQVALADPDADVHALRLTCEEALQLSGQQEQLIDALLTLATSERGVERWDRVDLARLVEDVVLSRRHDADRLGVRVDATLDEATALGDASLIESLVANLLDNAIRHNVVSGVVEISTVTTDGGGAALSIGNTDRSSRRRTRHFTSRPPGRRARSRARTRDRAGDRDGTRCRPDRSLAGRGRARGLGQLRPLRSGRPDPGRGRLSPGPRLNPQRGVDAVEEVGQRDHGHQRR